MHPLPGSYQASSSTSRLKKGADHKFQRRKDGDFLCLMHLRSLLRPYAGELLQTTRCELRPIAESTMLFIRQAETADANSRSGQLGATLLMKSDLCWVKEGEDVPELEVPATSSSTKQKNRQWSNRIRSPGHWPERARDMPIAKQSFFDQWMIWRMFQESRENTGETKRCFHGGLKTSFSLVHLAGLLGCIFSIYQPSWLSQSSV